MFGAVDYGSGEVTTLIARHGNGTQFRHFVQQLVTRYADGQLVLVADNATYHTSTAVRQWLQRLGDRVHLLWLPTYSPHLNLIERLWRVLKSRVACHRFWNDMPSLIHLANAVLHRMHASFSTTPYPHVRVE